MTRREQQSRSRGPSKGQVQWVAATGHAQAWRTTAACPEAQTAIGIPRDRADPGSARACQVCQVCQVCHGVGVCAIESRCRTRPEEPPRLQLGWPARSIVCRSTVHAQRLRILFVVVLRPDMVGVSRARGCGGGGKRGWPEVGVGLKCSRTATRGGSGGTGGGTLSRNGQ